MIEKVQTCELSIEDIKKTNAQLTRTIWQKRDHMANDIFQMSMIKLEMLEAIHEENIDDIILCAERIQDLLKRIDIDASIIKTSARNIFREELGDEFKRSYKEIFANS
jgi:hypothetical protein